jgi:hypothetical protein
MRAILRVPGVRASRTENQEPGTENHVHPGCAGVPPACTRSRRDVGCAGVPPACAQSCAYQECGRPEPRTKNQEPRTTCILGAQASRPHTRNPAHAGSAGVPNREPRTKNREPRASWVRRRLARIRAILRMLGARASRTESQEPGTENHMPPGCAGVSPAWARPRRVPGARASRPHAHDPGAYRERGRPARMCAAPALNGSAPRCSIMTANEDQAQAY